MENIEYITYITVMDNVEMEYIGQGEFTGFHEEHRDFETFIFTNNEYLELLNEGATLSYEEWLESYLIEYVKDLGGAVNA